jgi:hypothetical protein
MNLTEADALLGVAIPAFARQLYEPEDGHYRRDGDWWVVWKLDRVVADNREACSIGTLPRELLAIGDDGAGNPFCVPLTGEDEVLRWNLIDLAVERVEGSLHDFVAEWVEHN